MVIPVEFDNSTTKTEQEKHVLVPMKNIVFGKIAFKSRIIVHLTQITNHFLHLLH